MTKLIIGLDLSFNSTGICVTSFDSENVAQKMEFYKILFDSEHNITGKPYTPHEIKNVNQIIYKMPTNILVDDLLLTEQKNDKEQIQSTLRVMICSKKIVSLLNKIIIKHKPTTIIYSFENYIMPAFSGKNQLKTVSGLITLQGLIREKVIMLSKTHNTHIKLTCPTPTANKNNFTSDGKADKQKMINTFIKHYDGNKLLPNLSVGKIDDLVDAFSLMVWGYSHYLKQNQNKKEIIPII